MRSIHRGLFKGVLAVLLMLWATPADAQQSHSIRISGGEVYVDGQRVPPGELPASFDTDDLELQYEFVGDLRPVFRVGDGFFVLEEGRLREANPSERRDVSVIFRSANPGARAPSDRNGFSSFDFAAEAEAAQAAALAEMAPEHVSAMQAQVAELQAQAEQLQQLQAVAASRLDSERIEELERVARELRMRAEETARMVDEIPRLELEGYLSTIQKRNRPLFDRLVDERDMERETHRLAAEIRHEKNEEVRREKTERLRTMLSDIFELKQENRRREIEQLEGRLEELQEALSERERLRKQIVERRLRELLQMTGEVDW